MLRLHVGVVFMDVEELLFRNLREEMLQYLYIMLFAGLTSRIVVFQKYLVSRVRTLNITKFSISITFHNLNFFLAFVIHPPASITTYLGLGLFFDCLQLGD
jgi:hypothetical protein